MKEKVLPSIGHQFKPVEFCPGFSVRNERNLVHFWS